MVYKKYICRDGKKFGPYYFKSVRTKNGKVKSLYLGKEKPSNNFRILPILLGILFLFSFLGYFSYNAFLTAEIPAQEELKIDEIVEPVVEESSQEIIQEIIVEENIPPIIEINDSELEIVMNDSIGDNITNVIEINDSELEIIGNDSIDVNISLEELNETFGIPLWENTTAEVTDTDINISENIIFDSEVIEKEHYVRINEPVKKERTIKFKEKVEGFKLDLPKDAINISILEVSNNEEISIGLDGKRVIRTSENLITGNVVFEIKDFSQSFFNFLINLFKFTGFVVHEPSNKILIAEPVQELIVTYYLPGPTSIETNLENDAKKVEIISPINYTNISAYSYLDGTNGGVNLKDSSGKLVNFDAFDLDEDGNIDYIEWISPTSNENYTISITILNFQSFPVVGKNWTVIFNTTGVADLRITPINGTTWGIVGDENDLMFLDITCDGEILDSYWENNTVVVSNYSCPGTGYESSRVRTSGGHYLEFDFGGQKAYARNSASCGDVINSDNTLTGDLIDCSGSYGIAIQSGQGDFTLDCAGFMIDGTGGTTTTDGIFLQNGHNVTIKNCVIQDLEYGILSGGDANNNLIFNNTINARVRGIYLSDGDYVNMENNSIIQNVIHNTTNDGIYLVRGQGYNISDNIIYGCGQYGIYPAYTINSVISNNRVENSSSSTATGIRPYRTQNVSVIFNNITNLGDFGIRVEDANNSIIDSNVISGLSDDGILVYSGSSFNLVKNNNVSGMIGASGILIYGANTMNNTFINNTVYGNAQSGISVGVWTSYAGPYNKVYNNTIYENTQHGILIGSVDTLAYGNEVYNNSLYGIYVRSVAASGVFPERSNISHNNIYQNTQYGIMISVTNYTIVEYNNITDNWESSSYGAGVYFTGASQGLYQYNRITGAGYLGVRVIGAHFNNTWKGNIIANNSQLAPTYEFYLCETNPNTGCYNNTFIDNFIDATNRGFYIIRASGTKWIDMEVQSAGADIYMHSGGNNTLLLNVTADTILLESGGHNFIRQWYLDVNVSDGTNPLENINVSGFNNTNALEFSQLTNANGRIIRKNLTEYSYTPTTYTYYSNYTINTTDNAGSYLSDSTSINLTTNKFLNIILTGGNNAPIVQSARISPLNPNSSNDLIGYCNATDSDANDITYYYEWYNNGILNVTGSLGTFSQSVEVNVVNISFLNTTKNQNWTFNCMAYDGILNASSWENFSVTILNSLPNQVSLISPLNNVTITDRTPLFQWDPSVDADSDSLSYHLLVDNNLDFSSPIINLSPPGEGVSGTSHTPVSDLSLDTLYHWKVRAYDGDGFGSFSDIWNFTVASYVQISATTNGINFGTMGPGTTNNTADDSPPPFLIQNDGNCLINISINATSLFSQSPLGSSAYQFKVDNVTSEPGSFNWLSSLFDWTNMPSGAIVVIDSLEYDDASDSAEVDILVDILGYEPSGDKNSTVVFMAELIE